MELNWHPGTQDHTHASVRRACAATWQPAYAACPTSRRPCRTTWLRKPTSRPPTARVRIRLGKRPTACGTSARAWLDPPPCRTPAPRLPRHSLSSLSSLASRRSSPTPPLPHPPIKGSPVSSCACALSARSPLSPPRARSTASSRRRPSTPSSSLDPSTAHTVACCPALSSLSLEFEPRRPRCCSPKPPPAKPLPPIGPW
jgi:hypothetical protein